MTTSTSQCVHDWQERAVKGQGRGVRVKQCSRCHLMGLPYTTAQKRHSQRLQRAAQRVLDPYHPVAAPSGNWTPDMAVPRGDRD